MATESLSCPVCGHPDVQGNQCSNCETDLSAYRMLAEMPPQEIPSTKTQNIPWRRLGVGLVVVLAVGVTTPFLWGYGRELLISQINAQVAQRQQEITAKLSNISQQQKEISSMLGDVARQQNLVSNLQPQTEGCGGFYYTIQEGDNLSQIARRFYGTREGLELILSNNPQLKERMSEIKIGETIFVPNLESSCP
jgi:LysM repeat protein